VNSRLHWISFFSDFRFLVNFRIHSEFELAHKRTSPFSVRSHFVSHFQGLRGQAFAAQHSRQNFRGTAFVAKHLRHSIRGRTFAAQHLWQSTRGTAFAAQPSRHSIRGKAFSASHGLQRVWLACPRCFLLRCPVAFAAGCLRGFRLFCDGQA
jgi:hypothetical protein